MIRKKSKTVSKNDQEKYQCIIDEKILFIKGNNITCKGRITLMHYVLQFSPINDQESIKQIQLQSDQQQLIKQSVQYTKSYFTIPIYSIKAIKKTKDEKSMIISTKDHRKLQFLFSPKSIIFDILIIKSFPTTKAILLSYAYHHYDNTINQYKINGWDLYDIQSEFLRQKIDYEVYRLSYCNMIFFQCKTYPELLVVPFSINENEVGEIAKLRTKNRLPALTYYHKETKSGLWRCSQRKFTASASPIEVSFFKAMNKKCKEIHIYDARPYLNAVANTIKGAQVENIDHYENAKLFFCDIENIHGVTASLKKYYKVINNDCTMNGTLISNKKSQSLLEQSDWHDLIFSILKSSNDIVKSMLDCNTVLVHCSDGWDRTSQLCATAQILLDNYYRTIEGFCVLIEKDWLRFGHQFSLRNGTDDKKDKAQESPIFIQWLDVVHQIMHQFPTAFEFRGNLLIYLTDEFYSCRFGTFMFNCEKERIDEGIKEKTVSIWSEVMYQRKRFINPYYIKKDVLNVQCAHLKLEFWDEFFLKYDKNEKNFMDDLVDGKQKVMKDIMGVIKKFNLVGELDKEAQKWYKEYMNE